MGGQRPPASAPRRRTLLRPVAAEINGDPVFASLEGGAGDRLFVWGLDEASHSVWPDTPLVASDSPTDKFRVEAADAGDEIYLVWTDASPASNKIVAQNVTSDGSLGLDECPADLSGDGVVDPSDLAALIAAWDASGPANLDGDGAVDASDLAALISAWGPCS